ncbi:MAG: serine/threonine-protein kinase [Planctomycetaceae bacterium]
MPHEGEHPWFAMPARFFMIPDGERSAGGRDFQGDIVRNEGDAGDVNVGRDDITRLTRPVPTQGSSPPVKHPSPPLATPSRPGVGVSDSDGTRVSPPPRGNGSSAAPGITPVIAAMQDLGRRLEGTSLGAYHLEKFVGGGGMGAVLRALDTTLDRIVAVKVLFAHESADEEVVRRFRNEAQSAARLDHENIGRVHAVGYEEGWHFIVFEFIEGMNLRDIVAESGPFDIRRTVDVTLQLAEALSHAAERDVVHRDIKPSNVIITPEGRAKLVDMGLARLHQMTGGNDLTVSGMTLGTFDYISPEQARDPRAADVRSDLYSLGCTSYFLLVGRPPFAEGTLVQKLLQHQQERAEPVERFRPDIPATLANAVARLMEKDPADRYQSPQALIDDLAGLAVELGIFVPPERLDRRGRRSGERHLLRGLPVLVPIVGLLAIVAMTWWFEPAAAVRTAVAPNNSRTASAGTQNERFADLESGSASDAGPMKGPGQLATRLMAAADGERIEVAPGQYEIVLPLSLKGKSLHLVGSGRESTIIRLRRPDSPQIAVGIALEDASLLLEELAIEVPQESSAVATAGGVFGISGQSRLWFSDVALTVKGGEGSQVTGDEPAVVVFSGMADGSGRFGGAAVRFDGTTVAVDATVVRIDSGETVDVEVVSSTFTTPRRFLLASGAVVGVGNTPSIVLKAEQSEFSLGGGFACLVDSRSRPVASRLKAVADSCRFEISGESALLEQAGVGEPDGYLVSVQWTDLGSRYEGSDVFRRIDGAAERVEVDYASQPQPFDRSPKDVPAP